MRADARLKRSQLIAAARALFAEQGREVPFTAVAQRAEVGVATLYRHFPTRDDLILGVVQDVREQLVDLIERAEGEWDAGPAAAWHNYVHNIASLRLGTLAANIGPTLDTVLTLEAREARDQVFAQMGRLLARAQSAGLVDEAVTVGRFQLGMATLSRVLPTSAIVVATDEYDWLVDTYLWGLRPRMQPEAKS